MHPILDHVATPRLHKIEVVQTLASSLQTDVIPVIFVLILLLIKSKFAAPDHRS